MVDDEAGAAPGPAPAGDDVAALRTDRSPRAILVTLLLGLFTVNVTITILAVSIPRIAEDLGSRQSTLTWVVSGPILAFGIIGPAVGKLGDLWGQRRVFLLGLLGATVSAAASAVAWDAGSLIAFRVLAAAQGAATGPASFALISLVFPRSQRVRALGWWSMVAAGGPVVGVVIGGPLVSAFGWRALFAGQVPLTLVALAVAARVLPETPRRTESGRFDWPGAVLLALAVTPVLVALNLAPRRGWSDALVVGGFLLSPLAAVGFLAQESRAPHPFLPTRYLRRRNFALPILMLGLMNATYMGSFVLTPLLMQNVLGYSETRTGLVSTARPLSFAIAGPLAALVVGRLGERLAGVAGAAAIAASMVWMSTIGTGTPALVIVGGLALAGVAMGVSNPAMASTVAHAVDEADLGVAGAAQQMVVQVGVTFGIQLMQAVQQAREATVGLADSYPAGYLAGAVLALACIVAAAGVRRSSRTAHPAGEVPGEADVVGAELAGVPVPSAAPELG
ncbi:MAG TPA: MFS transporter [Acidimicrobiales bacterium]|nr:MFS transporter [Acidimicrobiales bacterium]